MTTPWIIRSQAFLHESKVAPDQHQWIPDFMGKTGGEFAHGNQAEKMMDLVRREAGSNLLFFCDCSAHDHGRDRCVSCQLFEVLEGKSPSLRRICNQDSDDAFTVGNRRCHDACIVDDFRSPIRQTRYEIRDEDFVPAAIPSGEALNANGSFLKQGDQGILASQKVADVNREFLIWPAGNRSWVRFDDFDTAFHSWILFRNRARTAWTPDLLNSKPGKRAISPDSKPLM